MIPVPGPVLHNNNATRGGRSFLLFMSKCYLAIRCTLSTRPPSASISCTSKCLLVFPAWSVAARSTTPACHVCHVRIQKQIRSLKQLSARIGRVIGPPAWSCIHGRQPPKKNHLLPHRPKFCRAAAARKGGDRDRRVPIGTHTADGSGSHGYDGVDYEPVRMDRIYD